MAQNNIELKFTIDTSKATSGMDALISKSNVIKETFKGTEIAAGGAIKEIAKAANNTKSFDTLEESIKGIATALNNTRDNSALNKISQRSEEGSASVTELKNTLASLNQQLNGLADVPIDNKLEALDNIFASADKALNILSQDLRVGRFAADELYSSLNKIQSFKPKSNSTIDVGSANVGDVNSIEPITIEAKVDIVETEKIPPIDVPVEVNLLTVGADISKKNLTQLFDSFVSDAKKINGAFDGIDVNDVNTKLKIMGELLFIAEEGVNGLESQFGSLDSEVIEAKKYVQELTDEFNGIRDEGIKSATNDVQKLSIEFNEARAAFQKLVSESSDGKVSQEMVDANNKAKALNDRLQETKKTLDGLKVVDIIKPDEVQQASSLRTQIRNAKIELDTLIEASDGKITPEIIAAATKAGELADRFGDLNALIGAFNPDAKFQALANVTQGVVGGFTGIQGALALVGDESEDVNKALLKVNGALALSQGINQIFAMKDSFTQLKAVILSAFVTQKASNVATQEAVVAQNALTISQRISAGASGIASGARALLATVTGGLTSITIAATAAMRAFTLALLANPFTAIVVALSALVTAMYAYQKVTDDSIKTTKEDIEAKNGLQKKYQELGNEINTVSDKIQVANGKLTESRAEINKISRDFTLALDNLDRDFEIKLKTIVDDGELDDKQRKKKIIDLQDDINKERLLLIQKNEKDIQLVVAEQANKAANDAKKKREDDAKKLLDDRKKANENIIKLEQELNKILRSNQLELEINPKLKLKIEQEDANDVIDAFAEQLANANKEKIKLGIKTDINVNGLTPKEQELINVWREQLKIRFERKAIEVDLNIKIDKIKAQKDGLEKELALFDLEQQKINDILLAQGIKQSEITERNLAKRNDIIQKFGFEQIELDSDLSKAYIEQKEVGHGKEIESEKLKNLEILKIELQAAEAKLFLLEATGTEEDKLRTEQLRATINNLKQQIGDAKKDIENERISVIASFGLDEKEQNELNKSLDRMANTFQRNGNIVSAAMIDAFRAIANGEKDFQNVVQNIANGIDTVADAYIEKQQRILDEEQRINDERKALLDERTDDVQQQFENELELAKLGYANNVAAKKAELDKLNIEKQKALERDRVIAEKRAKLARVEAIAGLVVAGANVAIAVSNVLKSAKDPVTAIIAIVEAVAMVATFIAQLNALKSNTGLGKGGLIEGRQHNHDGSGGIEIGNTGIHVEGKEYVTNKKTTAKYFHFIDELNKEKITHRGISDLKTILADNNISLSDEKVKNINVLYETKQAEQARVYIDYTHQKRAADTLEKMHQRELTKKTVTIGNDGSIIEQSGNDTKIIRK